MFPTTPGNTWGWATRLIVRAIGLSVIAVLLAEGFQRPDLAKLAWLAIFLLLPAFFVTGIVKWKLIAEGRLGSEEERAFVLEANRRESGLARTVFATLFIGVPAIAAAKTVIDLVSG